MTLKTLPPPPGYDAITGSSSQGWAGQGRIKTRAAGEPDTPTQKTFYMDKINGNDENSGLLDGGANAGKIRSIDRMLAIARAYDGCGDELVVDITGDYSNDIVGWAELNVPLLGFTKLIIQGHDIGTKLPRLKIWGVAPEIVIKNCSIKGYDYVPSINEGTVVCSLPMATIQTMNLVNDVDFEQAVYNNANGQVNGGVLITPYNFILNNTLKVNDYFTYWPHLTVKKTIDSVIKSTNAFCEVGLQGQRHEHNFRCMYTGLVAGGVTTASIVFSPMSSGESASSVCTFGGGNIDGEFKISVKTKQATLNSITEGYLCNMFIDSSANLGLFKVYLLSYEQVVFPFERTPVLLENVSITG